MKPHSTQNRPVIKFLRQPQSVWLRQVLLQVHLWLGVGFGLYVLGICVSGSALVYRIEFDKVFCPRTVTVTPSAHRLSDARLAAAARAAHPMLTFDSVQIRPARAANLAVEVWLTAGPRRLERLFDPYTGADVGDTVTGEPRFVTWLVDLHDDLLGGDTGRRVNGAGALAVVLLCATGAVLWWPGTARWRRSLTLRRHVHWRRFNWDLHSALGFWLFALLAMWALTGIYFAFPAPFENAVDLFRAGSEDTAASLWLDGAIAWVSRLHFGRTFGPLVKVSWVILGLLPVVMVVTGALMWWNRVLRRRLRAPRRRPAAHPSSATS